MVGGELYRYAFQGQEKDPETGKEAFQLRLWDGRIGRWLTTDPAGQYSSPYLGMGNNPMNRIDKDGGKSDWIPKVNDNGSVSYIAESGDDLTTFINQFGVEALNDIVMQNTSILGPAISEGFTMTSNTLYKMDIGNSTDTQIASQMLAAVAKFPISTGFNKNDIFYNYSFRDNWTFENKRIKTDIELEGKNIDIYYRFNFSQKNNLNIEPFANGLKYNPSGKFGDNQFNAYFKTIGGARNFTNLEIVFFGEDNLKILNNYTNNRFHWTGESIRTGNPIGN
jgi:RHS repeat-associated protein